MEVLTHRNSIDFRVVGEGIISVECLLSERNGSADGWLVILIACIAFEFVVDMIHRQEDHGKVGG